MEKNQQNRDQDKLNQAFKKSTGMPLVNIPEKNNGKTEFARDKNKKQ